MFYKAVVFSDTKPNDSFISTIKDGASALRLLPLIRLFTQRLSTYDEQLAGRSVLIQSEECILLETKCLNHNSVVMT